MNITNETKNSLTVTNDSKDNGLTWDEADFTWDEAIGTWDVPGMPIENETKNNLTITNETKL